MTAFIAEQGFKTGKGGYQKVRAHACARVRATRVRVLTLRCPHV